jgi:hypothetical protein
MIEITQEEFEKNIDEIMENIEKNRQEYLVRMPDGSAVAAVPVDEELQKILDIMPEIEYNDEVE